MIYKFLVTQYRVTLSKKMVLSDHTHYAVASIILFSGKNERLNIYFLPEGMDRPNDSFINNSASMHVPASQYPWYIDLIRNEKPIWVKLDNNRPEWHEVYTLEEPVGEGE